MWLFIYHRTMPHNSGKPCYATIYAKSWRQADKILHSWPHARSGPAWRAARRGRMMEGVEPGFVTRRYEGRGIQVDRIVEGAVYVDPSKL